MYKRQHHALLRREIGPIRGVDGALGIVVLRGGVGVQQDDFLLHRGAQGLVVGAAGGRLAPQGVDKELGGLGPGDGGTVRKGDPVGEPQGVGQVQIALRPDGSGVGLIVGEQPDQDGHRLREGDLLVGGEGAVPPPGDQPGLEMCIRDSFYPVIVTTGISDTENVEITSGVQEGDEVFVNFMVTDYSSGY